MLMTQIKPGSVVFLPRLTFDGRFRAAVHPVLVANGYHLVTVSELLGLRAPGSVYGSRENGPPTNLLHDIPAASTSRRCPRQTPSPAPMPNFPITDIPGANSGGPNNGA